MQQFAWNAKVFFPGKNKKNISDCGLLIFLSSMLSINLLDWCHFKPIPAEPRYVLPLQTV